MNKKECIKVIVVALAVIIFTIGAFCSLGCGVIETNSNTDNSKTTEQITEQEVEEGGAAANANANTIIEAQETNGWDVTERLTKWILNKLFWLTIIILAMKAWIDGNLDPRKPNTNKK